MQAKGQQASVGTSGSETSALSSSTVQASSALNFETHEAEEYSENTNCQCMDPRVPTQTART